MGAFASAQTAGQAGQSLARPLISMPVDDSLRVALSGSTHPLAIPQFDQGVVPGSMAEDRIILMMKRSPEQELALQTLLKAQQDIHSPQYHQWLTPEEFGRRFGASTQDLSVVSGWLKAQGFTVSPSWPKGRTYIEFSGTAALIKQTFRTEIHKYLVNGQEHFANATEAQIPEALAPAVAGIASLHNFHSQPSVHALNNSASGAPASSLREPATTQPDYTFQANFVYFMTPFDFYTIYNEAPLLTGSTPITGQGVNIAVVERSNLTLTDVSHFRSLYLPTYPSQPVTVVVDGSDPGDVAGDDLEAALDVEWASGTAPKATITMVVAASTNTSDGAALAASYIVNNNLGAVVSTSFNTCEANLGSSGNTFYNGLWQQAASQGMTVVANSGNSGSAGCDSPNPSNNPNNPTIATHGLNVNGVASTPYNIAVGGTEFNDTGHYSTYWNTTNGANGQSAKSYIPEIAWNESCSPQSTCGASSASLRAGSGGVSSLYLKPSWQAGIAGMPNDGARDIPDVSLSAALHDAYLVYLKGQLQQLAGTSASAPAFAGIMALVNQKTGSRQGQAAPTLYSLFSNYDTNLGQCNSASASLSTSNCIFNDITQGTNAVPCAGGSSNCSSSVAGTYGVLNGYNAGPGYDLATGLGSVNVAKLVSHWVSAGVPAPSVVSISPAVGSGTLQTFTATFSDPQGALSINIVDVLINSALDGVNACYVAYSRPQNVLYLVGDNGSDLAGPLPMGSSGTLSNSQCTVSGSASSFNVSGNTLTVNMGITFKPAFGGNKVMFVAAGDLAFNNSGWNPAGVWQVPGGASTGTVSVVSANPGHGAGHSGAFSFAIKDTAGTADLGVIDVLINSYIDGQGACYIAYSNPLHDLYLVGDDGSTLLGPITIGGTGTLNNSQCTLSAAGSSATSAGQTLTLKLNVTFNSAFAGDRIFYAAGRDVNQGNNTGWQSIGSWTVQ